MKKKVLLAFTAMGIIVVNLFVGVKTPVESEDLTLENIEMVGLSASETECDASNQNPCTINGVGSGTGKLVHIN